MAIIPTYFCPTGKNNFYKKIREFEEILPATLFFRVHNSHLVNLNHIKKYFKGRGGYIVTEDDTNIEVASCRRSFFRSFQIVARDLMLEIRKNLKAKDPCGLFPNS